MKVVILAGGYGTRISEETCTSPKPMVEIGDKPILWHIMKIYSAHGFNEFVICCGYKSNIIKDYFSNLLHYESDVTFDLANNKMEIHRKMPENWKVTLVETGDKTMTGGRLKKVKDYIGNETFCMTYGDGVSDVNIKELIQFHKKQNVLATVTAVKLPGRFGAFNLHNNHSKVKDFKEKPSSGSAWINGGFFVLEPEVINYIDNDSTVWEHEPMQKLINDEKFMVFKHEGFWQCMDTLRDKQVLDELWKNGNPPWKIW